MRRLTELQLEYYRCAHRADSIIGRLGRRAGRGADIARVDEDSECLDVLAAIVRKMPGVNQEAQLKWLALVKRERANRSVTTMLESVTVDSELSADELARKLTADPRLLSAAWTAMATAAATEQGWKVRLLGRFVAEGVKADEEATLDENVRDSSRNRGLTSTRCSLASLRR